MNTTRKPMLNQKVVDSLEAVQRRFTPADVTDPELAPGLLYLVQLAEHFRSPTQVARRRKVVDRSKLFRAEKGRAA